jgi:putative membrane protein
MQQAGRSFTDLDHRRVTEAVAAAEARTAAEIVPAVARSSGRYDRAEDIVGLWFGLAALAVVYLVWPPHVPEHGSWETGSTLGHLAALLAAAVCGFIGGALLADRVLWLRRLFTPRRQMTEEVLARAQQTFFHRRIHRTAGQGGILIYVSLHEHMAAIIADETALAKLGQATIDQLCQELTARLRKEDVVTAICETISLAGERLAPVLPRLEGDENELDDRLIVLP